MLVEINPGDRVRGCDPHLFLKRHQKYWVHLEPLHGTVLTENYLLTEACKKEKQPIKLNTKKKRKKTKQITQSK